MRELMGWIRRWLLKNSSHFRVDVGGDLLFREGGQTDVKVLPSILHQVARLELVEGVIMVFVGSFAIDLYLIYKYCT